MNSPVLSWNNIVCATLPKFSIADIQDSHNFDFQNHEFYTHNQQNKNK